MKEFNYKKKGVDRSHRKQQQVSGHINRRKLDEALEED